MSQENLQGNQDVVSSIFGRSRKRQLSSLFVQKGAKPAKTVSRGDSTPHFAAKKKFPLGLDIGANSIKMIQLASDSSGDIGVLHSVVEELPLEARYDKKDRPKIITEILKKTVSNKGLRGDCYYAVSAADVKVNLIKLPKMPTNEIEKAVHWEIQRISQTDMNEIVSDYIILKDKETSLWGEQVGVLAIIANKKEMFEHMALLESAGLNPLAIDIEPLADLAALQEGKQLSQGDCILFLDFGAGKTALNIIYNEELLYSRTLNISGNLLTKSISDYCKVPWEEAEVLKAKYGIAGSGSNSAESAPDRGGQVRNAIVPLLENMVADIDHTFKYFSYQVSQSQITVFNKIVLSGGSTAIKGLVSFLQSRLNSSIEVVGTLTSFGMAEGDISANTRLHVALGLALRGMER